MRMIGITILFIFNTVVSLLLIFVLYSLTQLTLGLGNGTSDNSALMGYIFAGLVSVFVLWFGLYQIHKYDRRLWLLLFAAIGLTMTIFNIQVLWFLLLMVVYFSAILLILLDKNHNGTTTKRK